MDEYLKSHCCQHHASCKECCSNRYNLAVSYKPVRQMSLTDHLSRAAQREITKPVFSVDLENNNLVPALKTCLERLERPQCCTGQDKSLETLKTTIINGWTDHRETKPMSTSEKIATIAMSCMYTMESCIKGGQSLHPTF